MMGKAIKDLWRMLRPYRSVMLSVFMLQVGVICFTLPRPWIIKVLIDRGATSETFPVLEVILTLLGLTLIGEILFFLAGYGALQAARIVAHTARCDFYRHLQRMGYDYFDRTEVGDLMARFKDLSFTLPNMLKNLVIAGGDILAVILYAGLLFLVDARLALYALAAAFLALVVFYPVSRTLIQAVRKKAGAAGTMTAKTFEYLSTMKVIQALTAEEKAEKEIRESYSEFRDHDFSSNVIRHAGGSIGTLFLSVLTILGLYYALGMVVRGDAQLGTLAMVVMTLRYLMAPAQRLGVLCAGFQEALVHIARFQAILETEPSVKPEGDPVASDFVGDLSLNAVTFSYNGSGPVLRRIDLTARRGEMIAIVGPSGSGKTTLASLLPRFYDIERGTIKIGDRDIRDMPLSSLRRMISVVPQDPVIFTGTVRDNIGFGKADATLDEIIDAARKARIHERIERMSERYNTFIGYHGYRLSGGEKQRIAMARAILQDRPIMILDEATSYLDVENEALLQKALSDITKERTTLVIAHRLSTVRNADRIFVLKEGEVLESGDHEGLMARNGYYAGLIEEFGV